MAEEATYAALRAGRAANPLVVHALELLEGRGRRALDLGAGPLNDARFLARAGLLVEAVDRDPRTAELARELTEPTLRVRTADVREVVVAPGAYDLIVAIHVLPFLSRADLGRVARAAVAGLAPGGVLCCTFIGPRDSWAPLRPHMTFLSAGEVSGLLAPLVPVAVRERRYDGTDARDEPKRWHVLRCLFRRP